jgi:hypothetical protein
MESYIEKEFLYYHVLDMFAQVHLTRKAPIEITKSTFPLMTLLVRLNLPNDKAILKPEFLQGGIAVREDFSFAPEKLQTPLNVALGISPLFLLGLNGLQMCHSADQGLSM